MLSRKPLCSPPYLALSTLQNVEKANSLVSEFFKEIKIIFSYTHEDESLSDELANQFSFLKRLR